jgi:phage-related protein
MDIYAINEDLDHLLLVDSKNYVINGAYRLEKTDVPGLMKIPHSKDIARKWNVEPVEIFYEDDDTIDYNKTIKVARTRFSLPLFGE